MSEINRELEEKFVRNDYLDKLEKIEETDTDQTSNILVTASLAHNHIIRIFDEAMDATTTVEKHRRLMTEGSKQWLRYENVRIKGEE